MLRGIFYSIINARDVYEGELKVPEKYSVYFSLGSQGRLVCIWKF